MEPHQGKLEDPGFLFFCFFGLYKFFCEFSETLKDVILEHARIINLKHTFSLINT